MPSIYKEKVLDVTHYNEGLFSFKATRNEALKFENGEFVMIGLEVRQGFRCLGPTVLLAQTMPRNLSF